MGNLTVRCPMVPGDVVLLDSYQALHGRDTFEGAREHAVVWLTDPSFSPGAGGRGGAPPWSALSELVNRLAVKGAG